MLAALRDSWFGAKLNGSAHGIHDANPDGERYGEPYGNPHEVPHGTTQGTPHVPTAEELLGLKFCRDERGVVRPLGPGQSPDLHPVEFMQVFLRWLMTQPPFPGNEVESSLLQKLLRSFSEIIDGAPRLSWTEASQILEHLGVKKRQLDGRGGPKRYTVQSPVLYTIPVSKRRRRNNRTMCPAPPTPPVSAH